MYLIHLLYWYKRTKTGGGGGGALVTNLFLSVKLLVYEALIY
jgi:hypothetical protein